MQKLDVTKPMIIKDRSGYKVNHKCTINDVYDGLRHVFSIENLIAKDGDRLAVTNNIGEIVGGFGCYKLYIINTPEQPAFSWDKPIRHIESKDIAVGVFDNDCDIYSKFVVFKPSNGGDHYTFTFINNGKEYVYDSKPALENYEPELIYEIIDETGSKINIQYGIKCGVRSKTKSGLKETLAFFHKESDAQLFRQIKERGGV